MTQEEFRRQMAIDVETIEERMSRFLRSQQPPYEPVLEAMRYSLLGGGKRIRPLLVLWFCRLCGGEDKDALNAACGIEIVFPVRAIVPSLSCPGKMGRPPALLLCKNRAILSFHAAGLLLSEKGLTTPPPGK